MRLRTVEAALVDSRAAVSSDWHAAVVCFVNSIDLSDFVIDLLIHVLLVLCLQRIAAVSDVARVVREVRCVRPVHHCVVDRLHYWWHDFAHVCRRALSHLVLSSLEEVARVVEVGGCVWLVGAPTTTKHHR